MVDGPATPELDTTQDDSTHKTILEGAYKAYQNANEKDILKAAKDIYDYSAKYLPKPDLSNVLTPFEQQSPPKSVNPPAKTGILSAIRRRMGF